MKYLMLRKSDREALVSGLSAMPDFLTKAFHSLSEEEAKKPGPADTFSPVQQCWHLADLEDFPIHSGSSAGCCLHLRRYPSDNP